MTQTNNVFRQVYTELSPMQKQLMTDVKDKAAELYELINSKAVSEVGDGRYIALSKTELESSIMWAIKGITS